MMNNYIAVALFGCVALQQNIVFSFRAQIKSRPYSSSFLPLKEDFEPFQRRNANIGELKHSSSATTLMASVASFDSITLPRLQNEHIEELTKKNYVVVPNFISSTLQEELQNDVTILRNSDQYFKIAKIGQDSTNSLNRQIREAQTCFFGSQLPQNNGRGELLSILQQVSDDLSNNPILQSPTLDNNLIELLYAYYPRGGFYRRHRDSIAGSASVLRTYSLLLYLNRNWKESDGGHLRLHLDSGLDECPPNEEPQFVDIKPEGGTLVLFSSDKIPHEVLDTNAERLAVVGWYNKKLSLSDISQLSEGGVDPVRLGLLAVAAALVTVGLANLL